MTTMSAKPESKCLELRLSRREALLVNNCLNEVVNGFYVDAFDSRLGATEAEVEARLKSINTLLCSTNTDDPGADLVIALTMSDLRVWIQSLQVSMEELGDEFSIRVGETISVAIRLQTMLRCRAENAIHLPSPPQCSA